MNRGRVRLNRWDRRKMGELYCGREAETGKSLKSKRVKESLFVKAFCLLRLC